MDQGDGWRHGRVNGVTCTVEALRMKGRWRRKGSHPSKSRELTRRAALKLNQLTIPSFVLRGAESTVAWKRADVGE
jgi:hypothetical protein